jgi:hypothetical protein
MPISNNNTKRVREWYKARGGTLNNNNINHFIKVINSSHQPIVNVLSATTPKNFKNTMYRLLGIHLNRSRNNRNTSKAAETLLSMRK